MSEQRFDLFGNPIPEGKGKRGRPAHVPTLEMSNRVKMLLAMGWTNERIARACNVTTPTLRKHYFSILKTRDEMRDRLDARRLELAFREAEKGNVGAMRLFTTLIEKNDLALADAAARRAGSDKVGDDAAVGKKELARRAAQSAVTDTDGGPAGEVAGPWGSDLKPGIH